MHVSQFVRWWKSLPIGRRSCSSRVGLVSPSQLKIAELARLVGLRESFTFPAGKEQGNRPAHEHGHEAEAKV